jgi:heme-degrading monooxygenase HmoA
MFAVVFEVHPAPGKKDEYLALAKNLKPMLESIDGFIDNERFESRRREGWVLSLSTGRDEKAVMRWRSQGEHHRIQEQGRSGIFSDYHLRVCEVTADSHPPEGLNSAWTPPSSATPRRWQSQNSLLLQMQRLPLIPT